MRKLYLLFVMALALSLSSVAFANEGDMAKAELEMVDESGYHGKAHLKDMGDGMTHVKVHIEGMSEDMSMPAHIHMGTTDEYGPPKYALNNVENGMSETEVEVSLEELTSEEHVIAVHMSEEDLTVVAVGEIHKMESEDEQSEDGQHEDEQQSEEGQQSEDEQSEDEQSEEGQQSEDGQHEDEQSEDMPEDMPETGAGGMADSRNSVPVAALALVGAVLAAGTVLVTRARNI